MRCGNCNYTDGNVYTSNPPKVKCTLTREFHCGDDECNVVFSPGVAVLPCEIKGNEIHFDDRPAVGDVNCMVCGESIVVLAGEMWGPRICDKCKAAIMKIREG